MINIQTQTSQTPSTLHLKLWMNSLETKTSLASLNKTTNSSKWISNSKPTSWTICRISRLSKPNHRVASSLTSSTLNNNSSSNTSNRWWTTWWWEVVATAKETKTNSTCKCSNSSSLSGLLSSAKKLRHKLKIKIKALTCSSSNLTQVCHSSSSSRIIWTQGLDPSKALGNSNPRTHTMAALLTSTRCNRKDQFPSSSRISVR